MKAKKCPLLRASAGMNDFKLVPVLAQLCDHTLHRAHNPIHLWFPGVRYDHDAHAQLLIAPNGNGRKCKVARQTRKAGE